MKKHRRMLVVVGVLLVGMLAAWGYSAANASTSFDPARLVTVEKGTMIVSVVATGKIEPITKVEIKSKANGIIERLHVDVDELVQPGQVLAELDRENLTARLREAKANLQAAEAARDAAVAQVRKNEIEAESPELDLARRSLARAEQLFGQNLLPQSTLEETKAAFAQAEVRHRAAAGQLVIAQARVVEATANVAQARAAVERAEEELAQATIRAPVRGTVLTRDVEVGSPVSSILNLGANATLVMTIGDIGQVYVKGKVDEADIGRVHVGQSARITTESYRDRIFAGKVTQISPIGVEKDNVTTFAVEVSIENPGKVLKANMTANAEIVLDELPDSLLVPEAAVVYDADRRAYVDVVDGTRKEGKRRVPVTLGVGNGSRIQIRSGVASGDQIVLPG
ncbi:MAG: efflux RND transporter periplasmic adaptor subunit [Acidobacteria bacterium]|nr:efflux RND transporter periplasmic adaptor subunit [Acidobacteriota bacterium]